MSYLSDNFPDYDCDENGVVFKNQQVAKVFKSNKYLQVLLHDIHGNSKVCGVHTVVAMKYLNYFEGCVVHHKDGNTHNNAVHNLEVLSKSTHGRIHGLTNEAFKMLNKGKPAWNRGIKMSKEFCDHCSESAKARGFVGNQFVDKYGNKR